MKRKKLLRSLKLMAKSLPENTYKVYHKFYEPQEEIDERGKKVLQFGYLSTHQVNHGRRLKKQYDLEGFLGVENYLRNYGYSMFPQPETAL
jgi:hypothetical protein